MLAGKLIPCTAIFTFIKGYNKYKEANGQQAQSKNKVTPTALHFSMKANEEQVATIQQQGYSSGWIIDAVTAATISCYG